MFKLLIVENTLGAKKTKDEVWFNPEHISHVVFQSGYLDYQTKYPDVAVICFKNGNTVRVNADDYKKIMEKKNDDV